MNFGMALKITLSFLINRIPWRILCFLWIYLGSQSSFGASSTNGGRSPSSSARPLVIMIDPGHGGIDSGAVQKGLKESVLVLQFAQKLEEELTKGNAFSVFLTRTKDVKIPLDERVRRAEESHADVVLSLHLNSSEDPRVSGTEIFIQNSLPMEEENLELAEWESESGESFSESLPRLQGGGGIAANLKSDVKDILIDLHRQEKMRASFYLSQWLKELWSHRSASQFPYRDSSEKSSPVILRQAPFRMVKAPSMPSLLIELGYLTNAKDADQLHQEAVQKEMISKIRLALLKYKEKIDKGLPATLH